ncbi:MAG: hypothetical protein J2P25_13980 [Nocardiopsaceae bacterium]|nr:hypothetical protein [Nocardiopsaceae bacterium]
MSDVNAIPSNYTPTHAQCNELISKCEDGMTKLVQEFNARSSQISSATGGIPLVGEATDEMLKEASKLLDDTYQKVMEYIRENVVFVWFYDLGPAWISLASQAGEMAHEIDLLKEDEQKAWQGIAGGAYKSGVSNQSTALAELQSLANSISSACTWTGEAGITFFFALATAAVGAIAAIVTAGAVGLIVALAVLVATIGIAVSLLHFALEAQARSLEMVLEPSEYFPGAKWPVATTMKTSAAPSASKLHQLHEEHEKHEEHEESTSVNSPGLFPGEVVVGRSQDVA